MAITTLAGACDSGTSETGAPGTSTPATATPRASQQPSGTTTDGSTAKTILDQSFTGREELGGGYGKLQADLGNTMPAPDKNVLTVTFAFVCTGGGKADVKFTATGKNVPATAHYSVGCSRSVLQQSVDVTGAGPMTFEAHTTGSDNGSFAYAYYSEKKQLPNEAPPAESG